MQLLPAVFARHGPPNVDTSMMIDVRGLADVPVRSACVRALCGYISSRFSPER